MLCPSHNLRFILIISVNLSLTYYQCAYFCVCELKHTGGYSQY